MILETWRTQRADSASLRKWASRGAETRRLKRQLEAEQQAALVVPQPPPKQSKRRLWTAQEDEWLRKFAAEGQSNRWIGHVMGWHYTKIQRRRVELGIPSRIKGGYPRQENPNNGSAKQRAAVAEANRRRWQNSEYRERMIAILQQGHRFLHQQPRRMPPDGTPEYKLYKKLRSAGVSYEDALREVGAG